MVDVGAMLSGELPRSRPGKAPLSFLCVPPRGLRKQGWAGGEGETAISEVRLHRTEGNPESCFHIDGGAILCSGLELPLGDSFAGELVEAVVDAAQHAHFAYASVGVDDGVEDDGAAYVLAHEFQGISGIDFAGGHGRGEIGGG
jgi:hypothetical protein